MTAHEDAVLRALRRHGPCTLSQLRPDAEGRDVYGTVTQVEHTVRQLWARGLVEKVDDGRSPMLWDVVR